MGIHQEWLNEGDKVFDSFQVKYFEELIQFKAEHQKLWDRWRKNE